MNPLGFCAGPSHSSHCVQAELALVGSNRQHDGQRNIYMLVSWISKCIVYLLEFQHFGIVDFNKYGFPTGIFTLLRRGPQIVRMNWLPNK